MSAASEPVGTQRHCGLYVVALLDVLGQSELLKDATWPLDPNQDKKAAIEPCVQAKSNVIFMREAFEAHYRSYRAEAARDQGLNPEQRARRAWFFSSEVEFSRFSDTIIAYVNLPRDPTLLQGAYSVLNTCAAVFLGSLAMGIPLRGAIEVGYADKLPDKDIFGPVLARAQHLESRLAQWPRILIGDGLVTYLRMMVESADGVEMDAAISHLIESCIALMTKDIDGWAVLDYLGEHERSIAAQTGGIKRNAEVQRWISERHPTPAPVEPVNAERMAYCFVKGQAEKYREQRIEKLALRYAATLQYFQSRAHLWPGLVDEHEGTTI